jgi:hypothetical protein
MLSRKRTVLDAIAAQFTGSKPGDMLRCTIHAADGIGSFTESWLCIDCGANTAPGFPDGPTLRRELTLKPEVPVYVDGTSEIYMVRARVWKQAGMKPFDGCLCILCFEARLARKLRPKDFEPGHEFNIMPGTARLLGRRQR